MQYGAMNFPIKPVADELADIAALGFDYLELTMAADEFNFKCPGFAIHEHYLPSSNLCFHRRPDRQHSRSIAAGNV
jgi:hypothetical protein